LKILVTGGLGFIGKQLSLRLLAEGGHQLVIVDMLSRQVHGETPELPDLIKDPAVRFVRADICTPGVLHEVMQGVDVVYHLAAETGTGQSMYEIRQYYQTNVMGTATLLEEIVKHPDRRPGTLVLSSSRSVYGEGAYMRASDVGQTGVGQTGVGQTGVGQTGVGQTGVGQTGVGQTGVGQTGGERFFPRKRLVEDLRAGRFEFSHNGAPLVPVATKEGDPTETTSLYAASKLAQEQMCRIACDSVGVTFVNLRFQNVYGPGQSLRNPYTGIISIFINALRQGNVIDIFEDGEESRDFVYIEDIVTALRRAPDADLAGNDTVNVGFGQRTSVTELVALLEARIGTKGLSRISGRFRPGDIRHCYADIARMQQVLGFSPATDMATGLSHVVDWALSQPLEADLSAKASQELKAIFGDKA
jgi:dTDP-L-rhamnose 4-epimerase